MVEGKGADPYFINPTHVHAYKKVKYKKVPSPELYSKKEEGEHNTNNGSCLEGGIGFSISSFKPKVYLPLERSYIYHSSWRLESE